MKKFISVTIQMILAVLIGLSIIKQPDMSIALKVFNLIGMFCAGANVELMLTKTEE